MNARWISEADVVGILDMGVAIDALEDGLRKSAAGEVQNLEKAYLGWKPGHDLHAVGAVFPPFGLVGTKVWARTAAGANPLLVLWDANDGTLRAVIEAFALGQFRTAAISGVATRALAPEGATTLTVCGTGEQALPQVAAVAAVLPLGAVHVWGRRSEGREELARRIRDELGIDATPVASLEDAVAEADVVTTITRADEPFLFEPMVPKTTHINAIGAIGRDRMELDPSILDRCAEVVVDDPVSARRMSRELEEGLGEDGWSRVKTLAEVLDLGQRRPSGADLTLFKAMGMGISDVALGAHCLGAAERDGLGREIAPIVKPHLPLSR